MLMHKENMKTCSSLFECTLLPSVPCRHSEAGSGVFVSDIQPGSCSDEAGLHRGDMILCVNGEDFVGINYDTAASILKNSAGLIKLIVANPNPVPVKGGTDNS